MIIPMRLPELGEHVESADLIKIMVSVGSPIRVDQTVMELETEKASFELPSSMSGVVTEIHVRAGEKVKVGQILLSVDDQSASGAPEPEASTAPPKARPAVVPAPEPLREEKPGSATAGTPAEVSPAHAFVPASPSVRRLARELGVSIGQVPGSGPGGRIAAEDVKAFAKRLITSGGGAGMPFFPPLPDFSRWGEIERRDMTGIRRKTAESMTYAWTIPHVTHFESADISGLEQLRKRFATEISAAGGRLTLTSIVVKVVASALKVFPDFAASLDMEKGQMIAKKYCHIGVAVDTDRGLIVPVIRDADKKNIHQLSIELAQLAEKARGKKITLEELAGAVFTITNLGGIGGTQFAPIIHAPEVAILGISKARQEAVLVEGKFEPRLMLPLSLSYDHRLIDGANAARFLRWVVQALEQPFLLPLEG